MIDAGFVLLGLILLWVAAFYAIWLATDIITRQPSRRITDDPPLRPTVGCFGCVLASEAGAKSLRWHIAHEHGDRPMRAEDEAA